jgi:hypothetical protein
MADNTEMKNAIKRALEVTIEKDKHPKAADDVRSIVFDAFDDLAQCLIEYGDKDLASRLHDLQYEFDARHVPSVGI